jgi:two-component system, NarL family, nitrate/nitrite response regulator NarL
MADSPRVLIVEDHALLAESLAMALRLRDFIDVEICDPSMLDAESVLSTVDRLRPDVILLDVFLGDAGLSIPMIPPLVQAGAKVLILTATQDRVVLARCLESGATGVFDKAQPFNELITWVIDAALGRTTMRPAARQELLSDLAEHRRDSDTLRSSFDKLTDREAEVLAAIVDGAGADEIAARQHVAVSTVRSHIRSILDKLGVNSQLAAVALARRAGWPE